MRYLQNLALIAALLLMTASTLVSRDALAQQKTIKIGTEGTWRPFSFQDSAGNLTGFEVDLVRSVCEAAKITCEVIVIPWESLVPSLQEGKIDAIASGMRMTTKRRKIVDFTLPYYKNTPIFSTCKHLTVSNVSPESLRDFIIGVQSATNHLDYLESRYPNVSVRTYKNIDDIYADLASGRLDFALGSKATAYGFLQTEKGKACSMVGKDIEDADFYSQPTGIALRKGDTATKASLDKGIKIILNDGTFERISEKYWPFSLKFTGPAE